MFVRKNVLNVGNRQSQKAKGLLFKFPSCSACWHLSTLFIQRFNWNNRYFFVYNFSISSLLYIRIIMTANTYVRHTEHWTAVSTLLGLISSAHGNIHHWRSNQQPQKVKAETLPLSHRFMSPFWIGKMPSSMNKNSDLSRYHQL